MQADGLPSTTRTIDTATTLAYVNTGNTRTVLGAAYNAEPYVYKDGAGPLIPIQTLREGSELFTTIVGTTASSLCNTVGQIPESQSASGPEVGELKAALAGSSKSRRM